MTAIQRKGWFSSSATTTISAPTRFRCHNPAASSVCFFQLAFAEDWSDDAWRRARVDYCHLSHALHIFTASSTIGAPSVAISRIDLLQGAIAKRVDRRSSAHPSSEIIEIRHSDDSSRFFLVIDGPQAEADHWLFCLCNPPKSNAPCDEENLLATDDDNQAAENFARTRSVIEASPSSESMSADRLRFVPPKILRPAQGTTTTASTGSVWHTDAAPRSANGNEVVILPSDGASSVDSGSAQDILLKYQQPINSNPSGGRIRHPEPEENHSAASFSADRKDSGAGPVISDRVRPTPAGGGGKFTSMPRRITGLLDRTKRDLARTGDEVTRTRKRVSEEGLETLVDTYRSQVAGLSDQVDSWKGAHQDAIARLFQVYTDF